jgi:hypothetical protein
MDDIEYIKNSTDLLSIVTTLTGVNGRKENRCYKFLSPFRSEKTPSFAVYPDSNTWFDFGTGEGGDVINFLMRYYDIDFKKALNELQSDTQRPAHTCEKERKEEKQQKKDHSKVRKLYEVLKATDNQETVKEYFISKRVEYRPEIGAVVFANFKQNSTYISIPCPYPTKIMGLECRKLKGDGLERLSLYGKPLWLLRRDLSRILVTESILDALAGEIVLGDCTITLCALNGVANKHKVPGMVKKYKPSYVLLALDNDGEENGFIGQKTQAEIYESIKSACQVKILETLKIAGVKDLHKLLLRNETRYANPEKLASKSPRH